MDPAPAAASLAAAIVPVMDLRGGCVVQARHGIPRADYPPLQSRLCTSSNPGEAAKELVAATGASQLYVADLDGLLSRTPDWPALRSIANGGAELWLDVGMRDVHDARQMQFELTGHHYRPIVATESVRTAQDAQAILMQWPAGQAIASLDMNQGRIETAVGEWRQRSAIDVARWFVAIGVPSLILLDMACIGSQGGCRTLAVCRQLHEGFAQLELISGGGLRDASDIVELLAAGCSRVLTASALHDGRIALS